jgi:hypothetical protein
MRKKRFNGEQIVVLLRQIEALRSLGKVAQVACGEAGVSQQSYYRWRKQYGGLEVDQAKRMEELERQNGDLKRRVADLELERQILKDVAAGSPERLRRTVQRIRAKYRLSERRACRIVGQPRGTQRYMAIVRCDEEDLTREIVAVASQYGRYGYRRITALLVKAGWQVGCDRVQRICRREGLKVTRKPRPRGRLWLNDGSWARLKPKHGNHIWSYDFVDAQTHDGRRI